MPNSRDYWQKRFVNRKLVELNQGEAFVNSLDEQYRIASRSIEQQISTWYQRFATNNQITMAEAKRLLTTRELKEFTWDVKDYIKYGEGLDPAWMSALENASARVHVSRLESLQYQMQQQVEVLYGNQTDGLDKLLRNTYTEGYFHTAYELQKGFNVGWDLMGFNEQQLTAVLKKPWTLDGQTFSDRLWKNKTSLLSNLQTELAQNIILGRSPDQSIKRIAELMGQNKRVAGRLVMTESAAFASEAQKTAFKELDVEQYEIVATLDTHTSDICQNLDGQVFRMVDYELGVTAPPFHPWCRSVTAPYFADDVDSERFARNAEGEPIYVPSNMKYAEWKQKFIGGGSTDALGGIIKKQWSFTAASNMEEVKARLSVALGTDDVNLARMPTDLGNQYLEGIETFTNDYPELKGYLGKVDTKTSAGAYGQFGLEGLYVDNNKSYKISTSLALRSPRNLDSMLSDYANDIKHGFHYEGMSPKMTAIHECTHALDSLLTATDTGAFLNGQLNIVPRTKAFSDYTGGYSYKIVEQAYIDVFGKRNGQVVYDGIKYLGKYAMTNSREMLAQCISYEYSGQTEKFSARVKELFDAKVKEVFKR